MCGILAIVSHQVDILFFGFLSTKALFFFFTVSAAIFVFYALWSAIKTRRQAARLEEFKVVAARLEKEVSDLREASRVCEEFSSTRLDNLQERLETIGGGICEAFSKSLIEEYDDFLGSRIKYAESEREASALLDEISDDEDLLSSINHVLSELESWFGRFNSSPFFKMPDESDVAIDEKIMYDPSSIQATSREMVKEIESCQKLLFHLEHECRSPLSPNICSSFSNFMEISKRLLGEHGDTYSLDFDGLRKLQKGDFSHDDPLDFLNKQEQRLSMSCPSPDKLSQTIDGLRESLGIKREVLGKVRLEKNSDGTEISKNSS